MNRRRPIVAVAAAVFVSALAGCGGPMQPEELARSVGTLTSDAAEGRLLARDIARDRTKTTFARVRARELEESVDHEAEKLSDATAREGIGDQKSTAVDLAERISQTLGQIRISPDDHETALEAERSLELLTRRTEALEKSL